IKRYYSGYTLAYASYGKEGIGTLRHFPAQRNLDASGGKADIRRSNGCVGPTRLAHSEHCVASPRTCEEAGLSLTVYELIAQRMVRCGRSGDGGPPRPRTILQWTQARIAR